MKQIVLMLSLYFFISCNSTKKFTFDYVNFDENKKRSLAVKIPKGKLNKKNINEKELVLYYKDSTIIFFSYDKLSGASVNSGNRASIGVDVIFRKNYNDTIIFEGKVNNKLYWKECIFDDVIVGYKNVPFNKLIYFENFISSAKRK